MAVEDISDDIQFTRSYSQTIDDIPLNRLYSQATERDTHQGTIDIADNAPVLKPVSSDTPKRGSRFWLILASLCVSLFLSALEFTAVSTALPIIAADLHGASFIWVGTAYALASSAVLPMTGGVAQIFGRRPPMVAAIFFFALGSAICGAAQNMSMLIAGRAIQGVGGGGIISFSAIILADLVPLKERGVFAGLFGLTWSLAAAVGPVVGGSLSNEGQWRWIFCQYFTFLFFLQTFSTETPKDLNLPICLVAGSALLILVRLPAPPGTLRGKLLSLDWIGAFIVIASTTGITIALTDGGVNDPWPSANILSPLIIGLAGLIVFLVYEARFAKNPLVPWGILANRTSASGYAQTFLLPVTSLAVIYYLPVYFQACKGADANRSGVLLLSMASVALGAMVGARSTIFTPRYRPQIWLGWVLQTVGTALLTTIKLETHIGVAVGFVIIYGTGTGINYALQVYPIQAPLPVTSNAHALSFLSFMRTFAGVWGVVIGGLILQNELHRRLPTEFLEFQSGVAIISSIPQISSLPEPIRTQVRVAFIDSLRVIWQVIAAISGLGLFSTLFMKAHPLHASTDKQWAPKETDQDTSSSGDQQLDSRRKLLSEPEGVSDGMVNSRN